MNIRKSKLRVDDTKADDYLVASLSGFICSPRDTPKGPCGVILFPPRPDHACCTRHQARRAASVSLFRAFALRKGLLP